MAEICKPIVQDNAGYTHITPDHSNADIARWLSEEEDCFEILQLVLDILARTDIADVRYFKDLISDMEKYYG